MNNSFKIVMFTLFILVAIALGILGLSNVKVDDFHKAGVIFLVDSSASNLKQLPEQTRILRQLCSMLDPEDQIKIMRVSEDSYLIYEGSPQSGAEVRKSMEKFTKFNSKEYGTAYGLALEKAFRHSTTMAKNGFIPAVVVVGDLENEGASNKQINWETLPNQVKAVKDATGNFAMMFLYAAPEKLDLVKEKLTPVLGEDKLVIGTETTANKSLRKFLYAIGR